VFLLTEPDSARCESRVILATQSTLVILALAAIFPLIAGQFDLSVAAVMGPRPIAGRWRALQEPCSAGRGQSWPHCHRTDHRGVQRLAVDPGQVNSLIVTLGVATILPGLVDWYSSG